MPVMSLQTSMCHSGMSCNHVSPRRMLTTQSPSRSPQKRKFLTDSTTKSLAGGRFSLLFAARGLSGTILSSFSLSFPGDWGEAEWRPAAWETAGVNEAAAFPAVYCGRRPCAVMDVTSPGRAALLVLPFLSICKMSFDFLPLQQELS
jgi:hypothetical protein